MPRASARTEELPPGSEPEPRVAHHAQRLTIRAHRAHGELGVVGCHRAGADHDRVRAGAQHVAVAPGLGPGDPLGVTGPVRDPPVQGGSHLPRHPRPPPGVRRQVATDEIAGRVFEQPDLDPDAAGAQLPEAAPVHDRVRIAERRHAAADSGFDDEVHAGRRAAEVRARLEGHVERGAPGAPARHPDGFDLGMRQARLAVPALSHDAPVANDDRADRGVRTGAAETARG